MGYCNNSCKCCCFDKGFENGCREGYAAGRAEGFDEGFKRGCKEGFANGMTQGACAERKRILSCQGRRVLYFSAFIALSFAMRIDLSFSHKLSLR